MNLTPPMIARKNGLLLTCKFIRKEVMKKLPSFQKFETCFENIPDLAELREQNDLKRKKKINKTKEDN